jgi:hypothetical protein
LNRADAIDWNAAIEKNREALRLDMLVAKPAFAPPHSPSMQSATL